MALGVGVTLGNPGDGVYAGFSVPMAFGVKFKVRPRLNIAAEFCVTKVFSDHIDGKDLSDLYQIKTSFLKTPTGIQTYSFPSPMNSASVARPAIM